MNEILGQAKTISEMLKGVKYSIDYFQREYQWQEKQIHELIDDLASKFLADYRPEHPRTKVADYDPYFLGSIIISRRPDANSIVDGQQRLTSLTLLLIYLSNLQKTRSAQVDVNEMIYSEKYGKKSFNLQVDERIACMRALFENGEFDDNGQPDSVRNMVARYRNIEAFFPNEIAEDALPYFMDWLKDNVYVVEITAYSDEDAYTIFETMNDRGLSLTPTEMLKGYLLAHIEDVDKRNEMTDLWKKRIQELGAVSKETPAESIKAWLRSQHAKSIRERRRGARPQDFDLLGTEFHRWVRGHEEDLGLSQDDGFYRFIQRDFNFYSRQYLRLMTASQSLTPGLEHVLYNAHHGFTLQYMLLLAPLQPWDSEEVVKRKVRLVARYIDILLTWRLWNFRSIAYSTMQYTMFQVMLKIRGLEPQALGTQLWEMLNSEESTFTSNDRLSVHQQNRYYLHRALARITDYISQQSTGTSHYLEYVNVAGGDRYEVEHIWANVYARHTDEFSHPADFQEYRNRIGGLLLLPKSFNASYGKLPYSEKRPHYHGQNLLAASLEHLSYEHNPGFVQFVHQSGLPFRDHETFRKADIDERGELYRQIAMRIWNPDDLLHEVGA
jgi:hypothetical protein